MRWEAGLVSRQHQEFVGPVALEGASLGPLVRHQQQAERAELTDQITASPVKEIQADQPLQLMLPVAAAGLVLRVQQALPG
jgi:hypothetical protein